MFENLARVVNAGVKYSIYSLSLEREEARTGSDEKELTRTLICR